MKTSVVSIWVVACNAMLVAVANGQQIGLGPLPPGPYYVGEPITVQVIAKGIEGGREPICALENAPSEGLEVQGPQVSQSVNRYMQFSGGRTLTRESASYGFSFRFTAQEPGEFEVGPFTVEHDGKKRTIEGQKIRFSRLANDPDMRIEVELDAEKIYVGQRIPVTIRWSFAPESQEALQFAYQNLEIRSPLFDQFTFEDAADDGSAKLGVITGSDKVSINAEQAQTRVDGRVVLSLTAHRTLVADSIGDFEQIPVTCRTKKGSGFRNSFFSSGPSRIAPAIASGTPLTFSVVPLPEAERPASFSGAVGSGFTMDVAVNRSVVRVGDPIALGISIRGDGNLEKLSLPSLSADGGMHPDHFQLPNEPVAGNFDGSKKQFKVSVRVKDESVSQIPELSFSWFDVKEEKYLTTRSKPIALQVMPAQLVTASDVVASAGPAALPQTQGPELNTNSANPSTNIVIPQGANLAIEQNPARLLARHDGVLTSNAVKVGSYALGVAAILAAVLVRRRGELDPAVTERKQQIQAWRRQIVDSKNLSAKEAAEQIAAALRKFVGIIDEADRASLNDLIRRCEVAIYAPSGSNAEDSFVAEALQAVDRVKP